MSGLALIAQALGAQVSLVRGGAEPFRVALDDQIRTPRRTAMTQTTDTDITTVVDTNLAALTETDPARRAQLIEH